MRSYQGVSVRIDVRYLDLGSRDGKVKLARETLKFWKRVSGEVLTSSLGAEAENEGL